MDRERDVNISINVDTRDVNVKDEEEGFIRFNTELDEEDEEEEDDPF